MTAKEIAEELKDMLNGDLDEYGEEGMETTEDAVHEACAAVRAWERIGAELERMEKEFVFAVCEPECESCIKELFEIFKITIKRAFEEEGLQPPQEEPEAEPEKFYKEDPETTRRKFLEIMKQGNT